MHKTVNFIGIVHSSIKNIKDCPLQESENAPEVTIEIFPEFKLGLADIVAGTEMIIFSWLHLADRSVLQTKPRNNDAAKWTGVFSTRSPDRPNPIGMHLARIVSVDGCHIKVSQLEVLDGTPIVDIKPILS